MRRSLVLIALAAAPLRAQVVTTLSLGANSRGYVALSQQFTDACTVGRFSQPTPPLVTFVARDATVDCAGAGWRGMSVMQSTARVLRSSTSVQVTDPAGVVAPAPPSTPPALAALSRAVFLDAMTVSGVGLVPDSARFSFYLSGSVANAPGANTQAVPTANFTMGWDSQAAPGFSQGVVSAPGLYTFAFAIGPTRLDRSIYFSTALQTFATLLADDAARPIFGSAVTDYAHTLTLVQLQFVSASGAGGAGVDVTSGVRASFASGADYAAVITATPEPATLLGVATGIALLAVVRRRRAV